MPVRLTAPRSTPTAVIKLGGSLLDLPDLPQRLSHMRPWWGARPLLVVGGGPAADLVRTWDHVHQLGEQRAHDLAVRSLDLTAALIEALWDQTRAVPGLEFEAVWNAGLVPIANVRGAFAQAKAQRSPTPSEEWSATTDTIAAWIAGVCGAKELWLLKSIAAPKSILDAAQAGAVDADLGAWCRDDDLVVHWVDVRATPVEGRVLEQLPNWSSVADLEH